MGHLLNEEQKKKLGKIDVLLIPVGGTFTLDNEQAAQTVRELSPRIAIPMHYKTEYLTFNVSDEHDYAESFPHAYLNRDEIEITPENIGDYPKVVILAYQHER